MSFASMAAIMAKEKPAADIKGLNSSTKFVLLALADMASDDREGTGCCWPSVATIARRTWMSERAVQTHLKILESLGWVKRQTRGRHDTDWFTIFWMETRGAESAPLDSGVQKTTWEQDSGVQNLHLRGADSAPKPIKEEPIKDKRTYQGDAHAPAREPTPPDPDVPREAKSKYTKGFERFWKAYPSKRGKAPSFKSWKAHKLESRTDEIVADVELRCAEDSNWTDGYIPNPQTYINQERWEDELTSEVIKSNGKHKPGSIEDQLEQVRRRVELETGGAGGVEGGSDTHPSARTFEGEIFGRQTH